MIPVQLCVTARDGHGHLVDRRYIERLSEAMLAPEFGSNTPAAILHKLYGIHDDEILAAAPFLCTVCGNRATALIIMQFVMSEVRLEVKRTLFLTRLLQFAVVKGPVSTWCLSVIDR